MHFHQTKRFFAPDVHVFQHFSVGHPRWHRQHNPRKAALASWIGSAVEYYDFFIYGTAAALVFGKLFFPSIDPQLANVAAFATFGVAYITRPLGAVLLGHIGDKFGRKKVLTLTLLLLGLFDLHDWCAAHV